MSYAQLRALGIRRGEIEGWIERGHLVRVLPKIYALGHLAPGREGDLWAALLYAGPGAALSHASAAQWRGLIDYPPAVIELSTPRQIDSLPKIRVYGRRPVQRWLYNGVPVTSIPQTTLDLAATAELKLVRKALARLDFRHELDVPALEAVCGPGKPGSKQLRHALEIHQPRLAKTNGPLEYDFFEWCEAWRVPLPLVNEPLHGLTVDAYWPEQGVVVELDGEDNHSSPAQRRRDKANDLMLRGHGLIVNRYDWELVHDRPRAVYDDLMRTLTTERAR